MLWGEKVDASFKSVGGVAAVSPEKWDGSTPKAASKKLLIAEQRIRQKRDRMNCINLP